MARIVKRTQTGPKELDVSSGEPVWVCQCGLSQKQPFCDGHHKLTRTEEPGKLYQYDPAGNRKEISDTFGDITTF
jgi:CDGSH iron-sulfur domain-containing protein 3